MQMKKGRNKYSGTISGFNSAIRKGLYVLNDWTITAQPGYFGLRRHFHAVVEKISRHPPV